MYDRRYSFFEEKLGFNGVDPTENLVVSCLAAMVPFIRMAKLGSQTMGFWFGVKEEEQFKVTINGQFVGGVGILVSMNNSRKQKRDYLVSLDEKELGRLTTL